MALPEERLPVDDPGGVFAPVRTANAFEQTVERLGRAIRMGLLAPGERLPSERDLAELLALSRSTVREALRVLQEAGYLEARRGRGGGTFVADVIPGDEARPAEDEVRVLRGEELAALLRYRRVLELGIAEIAAERATPAERGRLAGLVAEMAGHHLSDYAAYRALDAQFHIALAALSGSATLVQQVTDTQAALSDVLNAVPRSEESMVNSQEQHRRVLAAIEAHDRDAARVAMREHLEGIEHLLAVLMPKTTA
jgi:GntR family transcriptional repressor for pyruvate dehydrogenase complex